MSMRTVVAGFLALVTACGPFVAIEEDASTLSPRLPEFGGTVWAAWITQHLDGGQAKTRPYPLLHLVFDAVTYDPTTELRLLPSAQRHALLDDRLRGDRLELIVGPSDDGGLPVATPFGQSFGSDLCRAAALACTQQVCGELIREPCDMEIALVADLGMPLGDELTADSETPGVPAADHRGPLERWEMELTEGATPDATWVAGRLALEFGDVDGQHHGILSLRFGVPLLPERMARCNLAQFESSGPVDGWPCDGEGEALP